MDSWNRIIASSAILFIIFLAIHITPSYADIKAGSLTTGTILTTTPNIISIELSSTCISLVKMNQTNDCPSYKQLIPFDNSNKMLSGKFITTKGFFHRENLLTYKTNNSTYNPSWQMYDPNKLFIFVDPDKDTLSHSKQIMIVPMGFTYTLITDNDTNNTHIEYHNRFVDKDCKTAKIDNLPGLLNDTISYLNSNCTITSFHEASKITKPYHPTDITQSQDYKNTIWLKQALQINKQNCITHICKPIKDHNSKW